jgi:two-component system sensor histidine kinase RegB
MPMLTTAIQSSLTHQNLRRLCRLRYAALICGALIAVIANRLLDLGLTVQPVLWLVLAVTLANTLILARSYMKWPICELEMFGYFVFDVTALTGLLYVTGGATSPFGMMYLVPLTLTVVSLPNRYVWIMGALVVLCYSALMIYQNPLLMGAHQHETGFSHHIVGMWFGFVLSAALITWFGTQMVKAILDRDAQLARLRETELRKENVVALGTLAAGTAHELSTPLATLSILAGELEPGAPLPAATVEVLRNQVTRCKDILNSMAASAGAVRAQSGRRTALDDFLKTTVTDWQASRPLAKLTASAYTGSNPIPQVMSEQTLAQAITNLLDNAADVSPDSVELNCNWTAQDLLVTVADRGPGLSPEMKQQAGQSIGGSKTGGLGLGLFLTYATVERLGGDIHLLKRDGGGTECRLKLPLAPLTVTT